MGSRWKEFLKCGAWVGLVVCLYLCLLAAPVAGDCPNDCSSQWDQGTCNASTNACDCSYLYMGDDCSDNFDPKFDWDRITCLNGGRFYPPVYFAGWRRYCNCPLGFEGADCSVCANDLGCAQFNTENDTYVCDKSIYPSVKKYYNCTVMEPSVIGMLSGQGVAVSTCAFPPDQTVGGNCTMNFYARDTGVPLLFFCNFTVCSLSINAQGQQMIHCSYSHCNGTTFLGLVTQAIQMAETDMWLSCDPDGSCIWIQKEFSQVIPQIALQCGAGECLAQPTLVVMTPPTAYERVLLVLGLGVAALVAAVLIAVGTYSVLRHHKVYNPLPHIDATLSFHNVSCSIQQKDGTNRVILHQISGAMQPGRVTAIMGASGAGKTTFLDILAGRKNTGIIEGDIFVNGEPRSRSFKRLAGYVTQDDVFMGTLTVREYLRYVALLRLPAHMRLEQKMKRVDDCLVELGIFHIANSRIGTDMSRGISGGERKRLAIAAELVVDPSILLLDEPTSGLDSYSASSLIQTLQTLAHGTKNRTIVMSIHQPRSDIFHMFDYLMVFAQGRAVYFGEGKMATNHFASLGYECPPNFNPADFIIDTVSNPRFKDTLRLMPQQPELVNFYNKSEKSRAMNLDQVDEYASSFFTQFNVLTHRTFLNAFRNPFLLRIQYALFLLVGVILGFLYHGLSDDLQHGGFQNRMGSLFFIVTLLSFGSLTSIDLFFSERLLFLRERATGCYRTSAYFLSKAVSDLIPMRILPPLILGCIIYYWIGYQPITSKFCIFLFTLVVVSMTATSLCFVISSLAPSVAVGNLVAILLLFFFLIFGGFLVNISNMPDSVRWITNLSYMTFGYSVLMVNEFNGITIDIDPDGLNTHTPIAGAVLLEQVGMSVNELDRYMFSLGLMLVIYLVAAYLALRFAVKEKR